MSYDFSAVHSALKKYVDREILAGISAAVLKGQEVLDLHCVGYADREQQILLEPQHLFRVFSNTKLITSIAILILFDQGKLGLDDPVAEYLPQLGKRRVLRANAKSLDDTEAAASEITIKQLLLHTSGLGYGLLDHGSLLYKAYNERRVLNAFQTLAELIDILEPLPLAFHPGTAWQYSIASDVLGRVVEVVSGKRFDQFLYQQIFDPLDMHDTHFYLPAHKAGRLTAYYSGSDPGNILQRGLKRLDKSPYPGAFVTPVARLSGGGGLVSSLHDMLALMRSFMQGGPALLKPATQHLMMQNHLPPGTGISFPGIGDVPQKGFGLGGAVTIAAIPGEPVSLLGEFEWGGIAGTHWWFSPQHQIAGVLMTQRLMSFWHPFSFDFKRQVYTALGLS